MRSGELAAQAGVSTDTLRHYERLGLLARPHRTNGGYRAYQPQALDRVRLVQRALCIGFSLAELRKILKIRDAGGTPCRSVREIAKSKLAEMEQQLADLLVMRKHLRSLLRDWDRRLKRTPRGARARLLETLEGEMKRGAIFLISRTTRRAHKGRQDNAIPNGDRSFRSAVELRRTAGKTCGQTRRENHRTTR